MSAQEYSMNNSLEKKEDNNMSQYGNFIFLSDEIPVQELASPALYERLTWSR